MAEQHEDSNLGSVAQTRKHDSAMRSTQQQPNGDRTVSIDPHQLASEPVRTGDAPPVAAPGAQSTNTHTLAPVDTYPTLYAALTPPAQVVTPAESMSDDDFGSKDGAEVTATLRAYVRTRGICCPALADGNHSVLLHPSLVDGSIELSENDIGASDGTVVQRTALYAVVLARDSLNVTTSLAHTMCEVLTVLRDTSLRPHPPRITSISCCNSSDTSAETAIALCRYGLTISINIGKTQTLSAVGVRHSIPLHCACALLSHTASTETVAAVSMLIYRCIQLCINSLTCFMLTGRGILTRLYTEVCVPWTRPGSEMFTVLFHITYVMCAGLNYYDIRINATPRLLVLEVNIERNTNTNLKCAKLNYNLFVFYHKDYG